jgi:hypothetical protein
MSFSPLNIYTFAAACGQFLRPDVQALLKNASVGLYLEFANSHDLVLRREAEALRERLDALLFAEPLRRVETERPALTIGRAVRRSCKSTVRGRSRSVGATIGGERSSIEVGY